MYKGMTQAVEGNNVSNHRLEMNRRRMSETSSEGGNSFLCSSWITYRLVMEAGEVVVIIRVEFRYQFYYKVIQLKHRYM